MRTLTQDIVDLYNGLIESRENIANGKLDATHKQAMITGIEIALDRISIMFMDGGLKHKFIKR